MNMRIVTVNATCWQACKQWLEQTSAQDRPHIILLQEHKVLHDEAVAEAQSWAFLVGYTSVWTKAQQGPGGRAVGGTAIFATEQLGLIKPKLGKGVEQHARATIAIAQIPDYGRIVLSSIYGHCNMGAKGDNLKLITSIPQIAESLKLPFLMGGDFNIEPSKLASNGFTSRANTTMVVPTRSTCITHSWKGGSTIDYFVCTKGIEKLISKTSVLIDTAIATHRPVHIEMGIHFKPTCFAKLVVPPALPKEMPIGPSPREPYQWERAEQVLAEAIAHATKAATRQEHTRAARKAQDRAYHYLAKAAETEIIDKMQVELANPTWTQTMKRSRAKRGRAPVFQKVQVTFSAISKIKQEERPSLVQSRRAVNLAHLLRAHAVQSIRSKMPVIDEMSTADFAAHLEHCRASLPQHMSEHKELYSDFRRLATALSLGRTQDNWPVLRRQAIAKTGKLVNRAEALCKASQREEYNKRANTWAT